MDLNLDTSVNYDDDDDSPECQKLPIPQNYYSKDTKDNQK